jgi:tRNA A37 threonylcarbamoyladenosine dehydratase
MTITIDKQRRFGGIARLYGNNAIDILSQSHVCIIGIGGVGSWAAEALARSAVGEITLIDMDVISESNMNRQSHTKESTIGRNKIDVMAQQIGEINSECITHLIDDFITLENIPKHISQRFDLVLDCADNFRVKAALIDHCKRNKIKILTVGGAGGQIDPTKVVCADLVRSEHDSLLSKVRKQLRQKYKFPTNLKRTFSVPCVYSTEQLIFPDGQGGVSQFKPSPSDATDSMSGLNCAGGLGSVTHVTASFAFVAVSFVIDYLLSNKKSSS